MRNLKKSQLDSQFLLTRLARMRNMFQAAYAKRRYNDMTEFASRNEYQNGTRTIRCFARISSGPLKPT